MKVLTDAEARDLERSDAIIGFRDDGLFSRVMCLLNVLRLSETLGKPAVFYWDTAERAGNELHGYEVPLSSVLHVPAVVEVTDRHLASYRAERNVSAWPVTVLPGEDRAAVQAHVRRIALGLSFHDGTTIADRLRLGAYPLAAHVRTGDAASLRWLGGRFLPTSLWLGAIRIVLAEQAGDGVALYVASDSDDVLARIDAEHPGRTASRLTAPAESATKIEADLLDALALAQGRRLIGLTASAFGSFASVVAGLPLTSPAAVLGIQDVVDEIRTLAFSEYVRDVTALMSEDEPPPGARRRIEATVRTMEAHLNRTAGQRPGADPPGHHVAPG